MAEKLLIYSHTQIFTLYLYSVMDWQLKILVYDTTFTYQHLFLLCRRGKEEEKERKKKEKYEQKKKDKIYCKLKFNANTYFCLNIQHTETCNKYLVTKVFHYIQWRWTLQSVYIEH
jgi:hypothetical protein